MLVRGEQLGVEVFLPLPCIFLNTFLFGLQLGEHQLESLLLLAVLLQVILTPLVCLLFQLSQRLLLLLDFLLGLCELAFDIFALVVLLEELLELKNEVCLVN